MQNKSYKHAGFSLTEMSIVIVILALIIASVFQGSVMLRAAKIRAVAADVDQYRLAINSFYAKYDALPGDSPEAERWWTAALTENGDNNGRIEFYNDSNIYEGYRAWQHLYLAEMLEVPYTGNPGAAPVTATLTVDIPASSLAGGYFLTYEWLGIVDSNTIAFGLPIELTTTMELGPLLKPDDAQAIDSKTDDALPATGQVRGAAGLGASDEDCVNDQSTLADVSDDTYTLDYELRSCVMSFRITDQ